MYWKTDEHHGLKHNPFSALVAPRPIGWISTYGPNGAPNLAPYSFFNAVSYAPPQVMFSAGARGVDEDAHTKDSLGNVERTGCFIANLVTFELREAMNLTSAECPPEIDEFKLAGLTPEAGQRVNAPRVKESPVHFECELVQTVPTKARNGRSPNVIVLGEVVGIHIDESVITDGMIDYAKTKPVARLGYMADYAATTDIFRMRRPAWPLEKP
ncbi:MAG: flavin reductase family protein [Myxococcales bacterium]|nr:flavin reductase family protein [Myxococcales bacterium]